MVAVAVMIGAFDGVSGTPGAGHIPRCAVPPARWTRRSRWA